jgi:signal transduction histidine kinase
MGVSPDELQLQVEELRASRARVIAAADAGRRRIERELHDGVQQQLVALVVNLQLARQLAESDPAQARVLLDEIGADARDALGSLRELAQSVYPPLLLDRGLDDALRAAAAASRITARVETGALERYPPELEATVYFGCVEALGNVAAHAGSRARATVRAWEGDGELRFEVADDGAGFDAAATPRGGGLTSVGDRLAALGGRLTVSSELGRGTNVAGAIPLARC